MSNTISETKVDRLERLLAHDPTNVALLRDIAEAALDAGQFEKSALYISKGLVAAPGDPQFLNLRGLLGMRSGDLESAQAAFRALVEGGVQAPAVRYNLSYTLMLSGLYADVPALLHDALEISNEIPDAVALKVRALHLLGDLEEAIALGLAYLERKPEDPVVCGLLSTLCIDNEDFEGAEKYAELAMRGDAKIPEAWVTRGTLELAAQRDGAAVEYFDRALEMKPTSGRAWAGRGLARVLDMKFDGAIEDLKQATRYMPGHIGSWHALGWTQIFNNDVEGAKATFEHALSLDHNFAESHGALAVLAIMQGNRAEAEASTRRALGIDKQCFSGLFAQSLLLEAKGRVDLAQKIIERVMNTSVLPDGRTLRQAFVGYMAERGSRKQS